MSAQVLVAGYFGCGNLGDDAILVGLRDAMQNDDVEFTVMSGSPAESYSLYGLRAIPRKDFKSIDEEMKRCDALVFAGGSIFQDVTSVRSAAYYANLVARAKKAGKKVALVGQGVGPLKTMFGKRFAVAAFKAADEVVVRDPASASLLKELGIRRPIHLGADTAFLMAPPVRREEGDFSVGSMKTIGIAPRPWGRQTKAITQMFGELARMLFQHNMMPVLIEMDANDDRPLIHEIGKTQGGKVPDIRRLQTPMQVQERMARMDAVIAMRLHAGIIATTVGVPTFMISYDPKVTAFAKLLELHTAPSIEGLTATRLYDQFMQFQRDRERHLQTLERRRVELRTAAEANIAAVRRCLNLTVSA